jgi:hypothetical protein
MARIKQVLNERRVAYEGALKIHAENIVKARSRRRERYKKTKAKLEMKLSALNANDEREEAERIKLEKLAAERAEKMLNKTAGVLKREDVKSLSPGGRRNSRAARRAGRKRAARR